MPERMLIAFYQRMILANEEGIRALNELGHTVKLALDVRSSKVIVQENFKRVIVINHKMFRVYNNWFSVGGGIAYHSANPRAQTGSDRD